VNLVDALRRSIFKILSSFQKRREKRKKNEEKPKIFMQNRFLRKSILDIGVTLKQFTEDT